MRYAVILAVALSIFWSFLHSCQVAAERSPIAVHGDVQ